MGLLISALVRNQDQATSFIPLRADPAAVLRRVDRGHAPTMSAPMRRRYQGRGDAVVLRRGSASAIDMNGRIAATPSTARSSRFGHDYFTLSRTSTYLILVGFTA